MEISAQLVKELREKTGAGMMECKKALTEANGNIDEAIEYLRKQGLKASANKAGRIATDGLVVALTNPEGNVAVMLEINCETDFVAKNEALVAFAGDLAKNILKDKPASVEALLELTSNGEKNVDRLNQMVAKIGEKISLRRFERLEVPANCKIGSYIHFGSKIGVLVVLAGNKADEGIIKDVAMHVAATNPRYLTAAEISNDVIQKEKEIYRQQLIDSGKPAEMLEKILNGKIAKFSQEVCLVDQAFIKDPTGKLSVAGMLKAHDASLKVEKFIRYQVGEGMEKKQEDFAAEVAKMVK
ncbi:MAG: hypothetical protein ACD_73C00189G0002 [uncultured bacterium]|nr:MAG: hypothetical protein ACD_73C00189G0002 [uncultured bacterium]